MSGDAEQDYFADGIVEDIITALSRFKSFAVIARNSSFVYKGRAVDVRQAAKELGVRYVLEGSVRRAGNRLRITAQLDRSGQPGHISGPTEFDGAVEDVFDVQDRITESVVAVVEPRIPRGGDRALAPQAAGEPRLPTTSISRRYPTSTRMNAGSDTRGHRLLAKAIALDPDFAASALAYVGHGISRRLTDAHLRREADVATLPALRSHERLATGSDDPWC